MKHSTLLIIISVMMASFSSCAKASEGIDNTPVGDLNLETYLGKWYEIARFNHSFEKGLENVTAEYSLREDGKVQVINSGWKDGEKKVAEGKAKTTDTPARLKVSFFLFFYADYNVMMLDPDYRYALVGSKTDKYLWILSRTPSIDEETKDAILSEARRRGYDTDALIWVSQDKNI